MSVRVIEGTYDGDHVAVMFDTVTGFVFGPTFETADDIDSFVAWCEAYVGIDPRALPDNRIGACVYAWRTQRAKAEAEV